MYLLENQQTVTMRHFVCRAHYLEQSDNGFESSMVYFFFSVFQQKSLAMLPFDAHLAVDEPFLDSDFSFGHNGHFQSAITHDTLRHWRSHHWKTKNSQLINTKCERLERKN